MSTDLTNLSPNLAGVLYFGIVFKKLYLLYIGTEGVSKYICISEEYYE
jgi:hypothetical protein